MQKLFVLFASITFLVSFTSCHNHDHSEEGGHNHDEHAHKQTRDDHQEIPSNTFTQWSTQTELFVDYPVLILHKTSRFAAHLSYLSNFKPLLEGTLQVSLEKGDETKIKASVSAPSTPGLFLPEFSPSEVGIFNLVFYADNASIKDTFQINNVQVYANEEEALKHAKSKDDEGLITFSKEQVWRTEFGMVEAIRKDIQNVIRTSGEILPVESAEMASTSNTTGIVLFKNKSLVEGQYVKKGTPLFTINNDKVISSNLGEKYAVLKAKLDQSKKNVERSKTLREKGIISIKVYEEREREYAINLAEYETLSKNYSAGGSTLTAPMSGILKLLNITDGQYVTEGQNLAILSSSTQLLVEAEVSQRYFKDIPNIKSANIKLPWKDEVVSINDYNGKIISTNASAKDHFIPVTFKIANKGNLIPGAYLDVYLLTNPIKNVLTIPAEALMKDYNLYSVYVMKNGEQYEKRDITIGINDGKNVQVLSGLIAGEKVVTQGAYAIKMASMSSSIPAHGHAH